MGEKDSQRNGAPTPAADSREAKLAQALRANLRRRKAPASARPAPKPQQSSTD